MCGLVGIAGKIGANEKQAFRRMLEFDTVRGPHSTGVLFVATTGQTEVVKKVGTPWDLYQHKTAEENFKHSHNVLLGHNRWATQGKINNVNAHPFDMGNIIGAHNGTLTSRYNLDDHIKFDVDSENLYHHMENSGVADTIPKLNGAFALTWWNIEEGTVNMIRNSQRSLYYTFTKDHMTLMWASEPWMIIVAADSVKLDIEKIKELPEGVHHSFEVPMGFATQAKPFEKVRIRKLEMYQPPVYNRQGFFPANRSKPALVVDRSTGAVNVVKHEDAPEKKIVISAPSFIEYQKFVNNEETFYVWGASTSKTGQRYIQCYSTTDDRINIRCYAAEDGYIWKKLLNSTMHFKAQIKAFSSSDGMYLTVDLRSIEEVEVEDYEKDLPPILFPGYEDSKLTFVEFELATNKGCAWCSGHVDEEDADHLHWISHSEFICGDCKELADVKDYIKQAKGN